MERRKALTIAGSVTVGVAAAAAALAANLGLLGAANAEPVGQLNSTQPAAAVAPPTTVYEDVYVQDRPETAAVATGSAPAASDDRATADADRDDAEHDGTHEDDGSLDDD
jgi:hypothetical protein